jgi:hypothetical protein
MAMLPDSPMSPLSSLFLSRASLKPLYRSLSQTTCPFLQGLSLETWSQTSRVTCPHSLLADVFPGIEYIPVDLGILRSHISKVCEERRLVEGERWVNKILQLYQIQKIQHGLMMVGPSGSGKTNAWRVLLTALERLDGIEGRRVCNRPESYAQRRIIRDTRSDHP